MIRFTIITCTYNAGAVLQRTLSSVFAQTHSHLEHLSSDGASTDNTVALAEAYRQHTATEDYCHDVTIVSEPDKGLYDAMNKGIQQATGYYLVFLNAGDKLHEPTSIEQIVEQTRWQRNQVNYAVIYGETDLVDNKGHFLRHRRLQVPEHLTAKSFLQGMLVCHQSFYVRTDIARTELYDLRYRYSADYDWCIRIMKRAERRRLRFLNTHLILTDYLSEGLTTKNHRRSLLERLRLMGRHYGWPRAILQHLWFVIRAIIKR